MKKERLDHQKWCLFTAILISIVLSLIISWTFNCIIYFLIFSWMLVTKRSLARKRMRGFCGRKTRLPSTRPPPSASSTTMPCSWPSWLSAPSTSSRPSPPLSTTLEPCPWQLELWLYCLPPLTSVTYFYCIFLLNLCVKKEMKNLNKQKIWSKKSTQL